MKLKIILSTLCFALVAGFALVAFGQNGPAYYLDVNGTTAGFGNPDGQSIDWGSSDWSTDPTGIAAPGTLPSWYTTQYNPSQLVFGYPGTTGISNSTFTVTANGPMIAGVTFNAPCAVNLASFNVFNFLAPQTWSVPAGSTFSIAQNYANWAFSTITINGGGTINFNCNDVGRNAGLFIQDTTNGTVNLMDAYVDSGTAQASYELRNGTLNFATAASAGAIGGSAPAGSQYFKISGGTLDNTSGSDLTLNLGSVNCQIAGSFVFAGSSSMNFGVPAVDLGMVTPTITVSNNTLEFDGPLTNTAGLTKAGAGTLILGAVNTYSDDTTVNGGTLALSGSGSIASSPLISVGGGATFDVSVTGWSGSGSQNLGPVGTSGTGTVSTGGQNITLNSGDGLSFLAVGGGSPSMGSLNISGGTGTLNLNNNTVTINVSGAPLGISTNTLVTVEGTLVGAADPGPVFEGLGLADGTGARIITTSGSPGSLVLIVTNFEIGSEVTTTAVALTTGTSSGIYGGQLIFMATVTGTSTTPSGSVTFKDGGNALATVTLIPGTSPQATATYTNYTTLKVAGSPHSITAYYLGDATHALSDSSSSPVSQTITAKPLTYSGLTAGSTSYNGTNVATLGGSPVLHVAEMPGVGLTNDGIPYSVDSVTTAGTATGVLASKDVGAQPVTITGVTVAGTGAGNYVVLQQQTGLIQNITNKVLYVTGLAITNPPPGLTGIASLEFEMPGPGTGYDGSAYTADAVSLTGTAMGTLATNSAEFNLIMNVSGLSLTGADASNYILQEPVLYGPTQNGPAYYLDVNGTDPGFGDPAGTINGSDTSWTTDPMGTNATEVMPYWYDGDLHPVQLTFGNQGTVGISNDTFTVSAAGQLVAGVVFNAPCTATLTSVVLFNAYAPAEEWYVPTNSTFNLALPNGLNWAFTTVLMQGGGTINFNCHDVGRNAGVFIQDMANGTVNLMGSYLDTGTSQASYELRSGTLNFSNADSAAAFAGAGSHYVKIDEGTTLDNTSGSGMTLNMGGATFQIAGNFAFAGSSSLNLGTGPVNLGELTSIITVSNNTLEIDGGITGAAGLTKAGAGTLTLGAANTYSGDTTVDAGILDVAQATFATNSTITVASGAALQLDFVVTNTVNHLVLNGVNQPAGLYNAGTSSPYLAGSGNLLVLDTVTVPTPTNITYAVSDNQLVLNWPAGQGWLLQSNSMSLADSNDWFTVTGATPPFTNNIDPSTPVIFYRLKY